MVNPSCVVPESPPASVTVSDMLVQKSRRLDGIRTYQSAPWPTKILQIASIEEKRHDPR
jgi:hypothetical protein